MFCLKNKEAVITGGGSGIGKAISQLFAAQGARIHIVELNREVAEQVAADIKEIKGDAIVWEANVTNRTQVKQVLNKIGKIDILINNAGIAHVGNVENTSEADFDRVFNVNVKGTYNMLYAAVPIMKAGGGGVILNMASIASLVGITDRFAYSMSKGAIFAMSLSVARDYLSDKIRCNTISPARVHTPFVDGFISKNYPGRENETFEKLSQSQPIGRMGTPEEVAHLALYLCSDEASFISGNDYPIDGGFVKLNN